MKRIRPRRWKVVGIGVLAAGLAVVAAMSAAGALTGASRTGMASSLGGHGALLKHPRWSVLPRSPLGQRFGAAVVWDGRELLEFGGSRTASQQRALEDGAAFNPRTGRWRRLAGAPNHVVLLLGAVVWTGGSVFVFGGQSPLGGTPPCCTAGLFDPARDRWATSSAPVDQLPQPQAVWTGSHVLLAGVTQRGSVEAASLDARTGRWTRVDPLVPREHPPVTIALVATRSSVLLWSLWSRTKQTGPRSFEGFSGIDVFRLAAGGGWSNVTGRWPQHETVSNPVFAGQSILLPPGQIWCGLCSHPAPFGEHGYVVDPTTLRVREIPHGPLDDLGPSIVWTGVEQISINEGGEISGPHELVLPGDTALWNPATNKWTKGPRAPMSPNSTPVWDGSHLLVLGSAGQLLAFGDKR
ncbi:MAG: Kelch repeat-containing protein [Solirubrobacteraceae bacterium]